jgi:holo-[acyl-carrier protein] synthase
VGVGVDLVEVGRVRGALRRTPGLRDRVFTAVEQADAERRRSPAERYAARFAAKEAVMKALGVGLGSVRLVEIEVVRAPSGAPSVRLHGGAADRADALGITGWRVSLTHTRDLAQAVAVALGPGG